MMKNEMTGRDIRAVIKASDTLDKLNRKYGQPHGTNPTGIMFHACTSAKGREVLLQLGKDAVRRAGL